MRPVNLMKKEQARKRSLPSAGVLGAALAPIAAVGIVAAGYLYEHGNVQTSQNRLAAVQAEVAAIPAPRAETPMALAAIATSRNARQSSLDSALADRFDLDGALVAISRVMPSNVWLTSMSLQSPTPADKPPPPPLPTTTAGSTTTTSTTTTTTAAPVAPTVNVNAFTIQGYTYSQASVANLMDQLQLLPMLSDVTLSSTSSTAPTGAGSAGSGSSGLGSQSGSGKAPKTLVQFSVSAAVNPSPVGAGT